MPKIAIDYTPAYEQGGGIGRLVRDLLAALAQYDQRTAYRLFVAGADQHRLPAPPGVNFVWKATRLTPRWLARIWYRAHLPLPIEAFVGAVDLYHATDFVLPPTRPSTKTIVTVHDLSFVRVPDAASPKLRNYLNYVVPLSVRRADHVIADSFATQQDLIDLYGVPAEKITTLHSGIDPRYQQGDSYTSPLTIRSKYNLPETPYLFAVGTIQPRKNYSRLIRALRLLRDKRYDLVLVIAGGKGWLEDEMYRTIRQTHMQDHVYLIGFADDEDLPALYREAACVAYPSLYEGFGFPILEAMACGTPVVTSNVSSMPEVAGNAALLVDPYDVEALARTIQRILDDTDLRETLIARGYQQIKRFTWEQAAQELHQIYQHVLQN